MLKSPNGKHLVAGITLTTDEIKRAFKIICKLEPGHIETLFNPEQSQNVTEAVLFLEAFGQIEHANINEFPEYNKVGPDTTFDALQFLGRICNCMTRAFLDPTISVSGHLGLLGEASALLFLGYRAELDRGNKNTFVPAGSRPLALKQTYYGVTNNDFACCPQFYTTTSRQLSNTALLLLPSLRPLNQVQSTTRFSSGMIVSKKPMAFLGP